MEVIVNISAAFMAGIAVVAFAGTTAHAAEPTVIALTQTPCQFLEPEQGVDHGYRSKATADCEGVNARTATDRLAKAKTLELKPGKYVFRVANKNVPYELGFWLRDEDFDPANPIHRLSKTSVSGGGLVAGKTKDYVVELKPGAYVFSCPLNPTPNYRVVVTN